MKKILFFLLCIFMIFSVFAETPLIDFSSQGQESVEKEETKPIENVEKFSTGNETVELDNNTLSKIEEKNKELDKKILIINKTNETIVPQKTIEKSFMDKYGAIFAIVVSLLGLLIFIYVVYEIKFKKNG